MVKTVLSLDSLLCPSVYLPHHYGCSYTSSDDLPVIFMLQILGHVHGLVFPRVFLSFKEVFRGN